MSFRFGIACSIFENELPDAEQFRYAPSLADCPALNFKNALPSIYYKPLRLYGARGKGLFFKQSASDGA